MVTIAAFIDGPGLGQPVLDGLSRGRRRRRRSSPACCIVIMAIMLDRTTTAASVRVGAGRRAGDAAAVRLRRIVLAVGRSAPLIAVYLSAQLRLGREFPEPARPRARRSRDRGRPTSATGSPTTCRRSRPAIQNGFTDWLLNPLQSLIADSPWFVTGAGDRC